MTPDDVRKRIAEIQARAEKVKKELPIGQEIVELAYLGAIAIPWLCEELLKALKREDALISLRRNEMKNISSKKPLIVADSLGRNPDGAVRLLPDPSKPWLPLVED